MLCIGVDKLKAECRNQSDGSYPQAIFTMGISHTKKMKGIEKFTAVFYIALYLRTKDSEHVLDSTNKKKRLKLFQNFLFYCDLANARYTYAFRCISKTIQNQKFTQTVQTIDSTYGRCRIKNTKST